ncbi:MAG TPA: hypothetical protein VFA05_11270 [Gaiellaceae bacterium]|nr:hypothetical protein [Gaiellaceae bacterium]
MEYEIIWGGDPEDVRVVTSGDASVDDLDQMTREGMADPRFREGMKILLDHSNARWWTLSNQEIRRRADLLIANSARMGRQQIAFVVGSPVDFGIGRMLVSLVDGTPLEADVFDSVGDAREWLRSR